MLVLGIETSTPQTSVALGSETGVVAASLLATGPASHELVVSEVERALERAGMPRSALTAVSVGLGPGLFTGMRVGVAVAKAMAQALGVPIVGLASLDLIAFSVRHCRRLICVAVDGKRKELFFAFYRPVPGGVTRTTEFEAAPPARLVAELMARPEDILLVGNGTLVYRRELEEAGKHVEIASAAFGFPSATTLVELAVPRLQREDFDRLYDLRPHYVRKSDAEIAWDSRRRAD
jgi:tRNA threonylcarbamoyladenosine biosynthesis protein TsaB